MIIYDDIKEEHYIRDGIVKAIIAPSDFDLGNTKTDDEETIKLAKDTELLTKKMYIHIYNKPTNLEPMIVLSYTIWVGDLDKEPIVFANKKFWWSED